VQGVLIHFKGLPQLCHFRGRARDTKQTNFLQGMRLQKANAALDNLGQGEKAVMCSSVAWLQCC
jgi:hypothetical protein